jgi:hypothetical protein
MRGGPKPYCSALKKDGTPCQQKTSLTSQFCPAHDPDNRARLKLGALKGALGRAEKYRKLREAPLPPSAIPLELPHRSPAAEPVADPVNASCTSDMALTPEEIGPMSSAEDVHALLARITHDVLTGRLDSRRAHAARLACRSLLDSLAKRPRRAASDLTDADVLTAMAYHVGKHHGLTLEQTLGALQEASNGLQHTEGRQGRQGDQGREEGKVTS